MNRRSFLTTALAATAGGLIVPEWILDPPKGRSMVAVPSFYKEIFRWVAPPEFQRDHLFSAEIKTSGKEWESVSVPVRLDGRVFTVLSDCPVIGLRKLALSLMVGSDGRIIPPTEQSNLPLAVDVVRL